MSFPLWNVTFLIVIPCWSKKPFAIPRSSGSPFAIGSVSTVTVTLSFVRLAAAPANSASTTTAADSAAASVLIDAMWSNPPLSVLRGDYPCVACIGLGQCLTRRNTVLRFGMHGGEGLHRLEVSSGRPFPLDQAVDVGAEAGEFGQLLRRDLVPRRGQVD